MEPAQLTYPAPKRASSMTSQYTFSSHKYTCVDVVQTLNSGGFFLPHRHEFANKDAEFLALGE